MDSNNVPSTGIHWLDVTLYIVGCVSTIATTVSVMPFVPAKWAGVLGKIGVEVKAISGFVVKLFSKKPDPNALTESQPDPHPVVSEDPAAAGRAAGLAAQAASNSAGPAKK